MPGSRKTSQIPILMYHSISLTKNAKFRPFTVPPALFAEQMHYLHTNNYTPMTVTQFMHYTTHPQLTLPSRPVLLTFDDGFADFFSTALPILQKYHFTATVYIASAFIDITSTWLQQEGEDMRPMLSKSELKLIHSYGIECGGHTHNHPQLDTLTPNKAWSEIIHCKNILEELLGEPILSFAYPFGYYTSMVQHLVQEAGYTSACAVQHKMASAETNLFGLTRLMVKPNTTLDDFASLLNGNGIPRTQALYLQLRTPLWSIIRRSSTFVNQYRQKKGATCDNNNNM